MCKGKTVAQEAQRKKWVGPQGLKPPMLPAFMSVLRLRPPRALQAFMSGMELQPSVELPASWAALAADEAVGAERDAACAGRLSRTIRVETRARSAWTLERRSCGRWADPSAASVLRTGCARASRGFTYRGGEKEE